MSIQLPLPLKLPPLPERKEPPLPVSALLLRAWLSERVMCGGWMDGRSAALLPLIQQMGYDDVLLTGSWRLEFLWLATGYPHYRLYWYRSRRYTFGVVDVRMRVSGSDLSRVTQLAYVQRYLAAYLIALGWRAAQVNLLRAAAVTPLSSSPARLTRLFTISVEEELKREKLRQEEEDYLLQRRVRMLAKEYRITEPLEMR